MRQSTVTIAIPTFNRLKELREVVDDLCSTEILENERVFLLIQDNASDDGTYEYLEKEFGSKNKKVRVGKNQENIGFSGNFIRCVDLVETDYIFFLSDEDFIDPENFLSFLLFIDNKTPDFVSTNIDFHGKAMRRKFFNSRIRGRKLRQELAYVSGLAYNVGKSKNIIKTIEGRFSIEDDYYPNVLLGVALSVVCKGFYYNKKVCYQNYLNDCSTKGFQVLGSRWQQFRDFEKFLAVLEESFKVDARRLLEVKKTNQMELVGVFCEAAAFEDPSVRVYLVKSAMFYAVRAILKSWIRRSVGFFK